MAKKLLTIKEAAKELGVSTKTIRRWEKQGKIDSIRTSGGHRRFRLKEISPERMVTFKNLLPYIIPAILISSLFSYLFTKNHYQTKLDILSNQVNSLINTQPSSLNPQELIDQINTQNTTSNNSENIVPPIQTSNSSIVDSGISTISEDDNGQVFVSSKAVKESSVIKIESDNIETPVIVSQKLSGLGFIVSTNTKVKKTTYFNWKLLN
ncbi:recombinase family protein [Patescibacteria group bacterium]